MRELRILLVNVMEKVNKLCPRRRRRKQAFVRRVTSFAAAGFWFLSLLLLSLCAFSADAPNFTGKYAAQAKNVSANDQTLEVVQTADGVEVTQTYKGKRVTNHYPLGAGDAEYKSPGGAMGKCKAQLKGKQLFLESIVTTRPRAQGPLMRVHEKQRWQLSSDFETLTIQTDVDFPDVRSDVSALVGAGVSGREKYARVKDQ
jgi:hypothetical protein